VALAEQAKAAPGLRPIVEFLEVPASGKLEDCYLKGLQSTQTGAVFLYEHTRRYDSSAGDPQEGALKPVKLAQTGEVWVYTIVHQSYPGVPTPFVGAIVDIPVEGQPNAKVAVRANVINVEPDPAKVKVGMKVKLRYRIKGKDREGNDVVMFECVPA